MRLFCQPRMVAKVHCSPSRNNMQAFKEALKPTPLISSDEHVPRTPEAGHPRTWFHASCWFSSLNSGMEVQAPICPPVL